jgi:hypothetical protein
LSYFDPAGRVTKMIDEAGKSTLQAFDPAGANPFWGCTGTPAWIHGVGAEMVTALSR